VAAIIAVKSLEKMKRFQLPKDNQND